MGRYRYRKYQHIGTFFSIGIIGIGIGKQKYVELLYPLVSAVLAVSAKASIGISAKVWYRPTPNVLHKKLPKSFAMSCIELCGGKGVSLKTKTWSKLVKWVLESAYRQKCGIGPPLMFCTKNYQSHLRGPALSCVVGKEYHSKQKLGRSWSNGY